MNKKASDKIFRPRGISREVAEGAFFPYAQGDEQAVLDVWPDAAGSILARCHRASGIMMKRWAVPDADPEITPEMRPDWNIWSGERPRLHTHSQMSKGERRKHVQRSKTSGETVRRGMTPEEYERWAGWAAEHDVKVDDTFGADHFGRDVERWHAHVNVPKYLFSANPARKIVDPGTPHAHADFFSDGVSDREAVYGFDVFFSGEHIRPPEGWVEPPGPPEDAPLAVKLQVPVYDWMLAPPQKPFMDEHLDRWYGPWRRFVLHGYYAHSEIVYRGTGAKLDKRLEELGDPVSVDAVRCAVADDGMHRFFFDDVAVGIEVTERDGMWTIRQVMLPLLSDEHEHLLDAKDASVALAARLSIHPMSLERLADARRVWFLLEGCLKEAAMVSAGEATFSVPSVTLWQRAPELKAFAENYLRGKRVFVVCDSDWDRSDDDGVIRQVLLARDALRSYGVDAHAAAPPPPRNSGCTEPGHLKNNKHGVDDHLGPCTPGTQRRKVREVLIIHREAPHGLAEFLASQTTPSGRRPRSDGLERDAIVLEWLSLHSGLNGEISVALTTVADNLKDRLGAPTSEAARKKVERAIDNLIRYGAVEEVEPIGPGRARWRFRKQFVEWTGKLRVVEELQSTTHLIPVKEFSRR